MREITYYCNYCQRKTWFELNMRPCPSCTGLLAKALNEQRDFNDFSRYGQIYKIPRTAGFSEPVSKGGIKPVLHFMKRLARKQLVK